MPGRPRWRFWVRGTLIAATWVTRSATSSATAPIRRGGVHLHLACVAAHRDPDRPVGDGRRRSRAAARARYRSSISPPAGRGAACGAAVRADGAFRSPRGDQRLLQGPFVEGDSRLFESGFILELAFAIGAALVLVALGSLAIRVIRSIRRRPPTAVLEPPRISEPVLRFVRVRVAAGPLGRRAPPLPV